MNNEHLFKAHQFTDAHSCLFINKQGKLVRVRCPFEVTDITLLAAYIHTGRKLIVSRVMSLNNVIHFEIDGNVVTHSNYQLCRDIHY
jgi:hypothetical protein